MPILKKEKGKNSKIFKMLLLVILILVVILVVLWQAGYLNKNQAAEDAKVLKQLGQIIELPEGVLPIMAKIDNAEALKSNQPVFFAKAKDGHRLVVYPNKAILFDSKTNKILNIGPVNFGQIAVGTVPFALYNGTNDDNKLLEFEENLNSKINNAEIKIKDDAVGVYNDTLVIDLVGDNTEINKIAESLGGQVSQLPEGETAPEGVSVLVIVGQN
jgi:membrane-associated protease RseP (regulator of RpoE activity)